MTDRAVSTVLDAALCLLLVSAAVGLLVTHSTPHTGGDEAAEVATTLGTSTETVTYRPVAPEEPANSSGTVDLSTVENRTDHGTVARLLASAAVADAAVYGDELTPAPNYRDAVRTSVAWIPATADANVEVRATWEPVDGGPLHGEVVVGHPPPPDADVHAASMTVPLGESPDLEAAARRNGHRGVAEATARSAVDVVFPPERVDPALRSTGDEAVLVRQRYASAGETLGVDPRPSLRADDPEAANAALARELATKIEPQLRTTYDDPERAAAAVSPTEVTVVVRTWSP